MESVIDYINCKHYVFNKGGKEMKKTWLVILLIVSFILVGSVLALGEEDFFEFCQTGTPEEVKKAIEEGADINARYKDGWTPLMHAARYNQDPEVTKILIDAGADINARDKDGWTPLMHAAGNQNPEVIKVLLDAGADGKAKSNEGKTAFDYAKENEHIKGTEIYWLLNEAQY